MSIVDGSFARGGYRAFEWVLLCLEGARHGVLCEAFRSSEELLSFPYFTFAKNIGHNQEIFAGQLLLEGICLGGGP
jgi:hypothetical protein